MQLPIIPYGNPLLHKVSQPITADYPQLENLIDNMWETMYASKGIGLACVQIGLPIAMFIVDSTSFFREKSEESECFPDAPGYKGVFINAKIEDLFGNKWEFLEGCLSIPNLHSAVSRESMVTLRYFDQNFIEHKQTFSGITARIILHEYDHTQGKLFIDHLPPIKRKLLSRRLTRISKGKVKTNYPMLYP